MPGNHHTDRECEKCGTCPGRIFRAGLDDIDLPDFDDIDIFDSLPDCEDLYASLVLDDIEFPSPGDLDVSAGLRGDLDTLNDLYATLSRVLVEEETKDQGDAWQKGYQAGIAYCRGRVGELIESIRHR